MEKINLQKKRQVIFDHDGSADDFLSLVLLLSLNEIDLLSVSVTPADCFPENAVATTAKILSLTKRNIDIGVGKFYGINPFPYDWRAKPKILNALPILINIDTEPYDFEKTEDAKDLIIRKIVASSEPVTVLMTGPCSNLVLAIEENSLIVEKIEEIVWMGGAVDVPGNVRTHHHDGSAEWNVFWDPISANKLLKYKLPVTLIPLDVTNSVPVNFEFLKRLALQSSYFFSNLAGQFWATTIDNIPSYEYIYFMWDVLATSYLTIPDAFTVENIEMDIIASGPEAGRTIRKPGSGQWVKTAKNVDKEYFYTYLLNRLKFDVVEEGLS